MFILLFMIAGLGYLTLLEKKGVSLDPCDMNWKEFGLVLLLIPVYWATLGAYIYFNQ